MNVYICLYILKTEEIKSIVNRFAFLILASAPPLGTTCGELGKDSLLVLALRATTSRIPGMHFLRKCS